jgi:hypothetical protein
MGRDLDGSDASVNGKVVMSNLAKLRRSQYFKCTTLIEPKAGRGTEARIRQLVKTWRYALILSLREKSEPCTVDIGIILKYACVHDVIEVLSLRKSYYERIVRRFPAHRGEEFFTCVI